MQKIIKHLLKISVLVAVFMPIMQAEAAPSCSLSSSNSNEIIVQMPKEVLVALTNRTDASGNVLKNKNWATGLSIPAGKYSVTAQTYDSHSEHGGQGQTKEQLDFWFYAASGVSEMARLGPTSDIPESADYQTTNLGTVNLNSVTTIIGIAHRYIGGSTLFESVYPVCLKLTKIVDPIEPPPVTPGNPSVSCTVSDTSITTGSTVVYTAHVSGGTSPYVYGWGGAVSGIGQQISKTFNSTGSYSTIINIIDSNSKIATANCPTVVVNDNNDNDDEDLEVECKVSDSSIDEGDRITIKVEIDGGEGPYDIDWSGDTDEVDDFDDNARTQKVEFEDSGTYKFKVTVEDDNGDEESDTCTVRVSDDRNRTASTVTNTSDGELASLSSVYLNQVPYTGPEDTAKLIGFISLVVLWSAVIAYYALRNKNKGQISARIKAFKQSNLAKKI